MTDFLIRNATAILTGLAGAAARAPGPDVRVRAGRIAAIGALTPEPGERQLDATGCVIYPAWVNTHHHLFQSLLKGDPVGLNATLTPWLTATPMRLRPLMNENDFRLAARIGLLELALSGCGTVADHNYHYYPHMPYDTSAILFDEAEKLGLRFVLCRGGGTLSRVADTSNLPPASRPETLDGFMTDIERLAQLYHDPAPDAMRKLVSAPTTPPHSMRPQELRDCAAQARRLGLRLHSHLSETVHYQDTVDSQHQMKPVQFCETIDWLGPDVWFAHLVKLDDDEIALLGKTRTGIAHCPQSNGRLGSGIAPVRQLDAAGAQISIGVDGAASNEAADMISETHAAWLMQRARAGYEAVPYFRGGQGEAEAASTTVEDVVRWGTAGGARLMGLDAVGTVEVGQAADLSIYGIDRDPRYFGLHDLAIGPVASGGTADLRWMFVGGKEVVRDGRLPDLDVIELGRQSRDAVRALLARL
ncbi:amidohydrolase family protein [Caenimonas sedimenti]|uniref:Amidohydrolase family protein n=1 Tax=Caenimonas sedimenti TaxID=2596921 RepID=A0A562ZY23_9BURK|nr:amidohydrolase family protein [Caenimonas sedimenti]TWO73277.1 amidohydrolase family protein [Caenimonas sedimenti]